MLERVIVKLDDVLSLINSLKIVNDLKKEITVFVKNKLGDEMQLNALIKDAIDKRRNII